MAKRKRKRKPGAPGAPIREECPGCERELRLEDAARAVCPSCQAPYHEACWRTRERCAACEGAGPGASWIGFLRGELVHPLSVASLLLALVFAAYANAYGVPFLFDDAPVVTRNRLLWEWSSWKELVMWNPGRALTNLSFLINFQLAGTPTVQDYGFWDYVPYHAVSLGIHAINAFLLYLLLRALLTLRAGEVPEGATPWVALGGAALWAVHPAHTMAVSYIAQRYALLAATSFLGTLLLYVQLRLRLARLEQDPLRLALRVGAPLLVGAFLGLPFLLAGRLVLAVGVVAALTAGGVLAQLAILPRDEARSLLFLGLTLAASLTCALTKENAAVIPAAVLAVEVLFCRGSARRYALAGLFFLPFVLGAGLRAHVLGGWSGFFPERSPTATRWEYLAAQVYVHLRYLHLLLMPTGLSVEQNFPATAAQWPTRSQDLLLAGSGHLLIVLLAALLLRRGQRLIPFAVAWWYLTHLVESSFIPILDPMVDHRMYLPSALLPAVLLTALARGWPELRPRPRLARAAVGAVVGLTVALGTGTFLRNRVWSSATGIWEDTIAKHPDCARAYSSLGMEHLYRGEWLPAVAPIHAALILGRWHVEGWNNLGKAYLELGRWDEAEAALREGIVVNQVAPSPSVPLCWNNLGLIYIQRAQQELADRRRQAALFEEATRCLGEATAIDPDYEVAWLNRATAEFRLLALAQGSDQRKLRAQSTVRAVDEAGRVASRRGGGLPLGTLRYRALALSELGDLSRAIDALLAPVPNLPQGERLAQLESAAQLVLGAARERRPEAAGQLRRVREAFDLVLGGSGPSITADAALLRAQLADAGGETQDAARRYRLFLESWPQHPEAGNVQLRLQQLFGGGR